MAIEYQITGMHCSSCVKRVAVALAPFGTGVEVTLDPPRAVLPVDRAPPLAALERAVAGVGAYGISPRQPAGASPEPAPAVSQSALVTYRPLILIAAYIAGAAFAGTMTPAGIDWSIWMANVMAGFFLVFSAFKMLDLRGFADAYATYDLIAARWRPWGYVYPFLELALGLAYLFRLSPTLTDLATIALMGVSSLGVIQALSQKRRIRCACLGTVLNLPMSTITLVEDLLMVAMAALHLLGRH